MAKKSKKANGAANGADQVHEELLEDGITWAKRVEAENKAARAGQPEPGPGPRQLEVPGTERKRIKPLDAAIAGIIEAKAIQKSEKERAEKLAASVQRLLEEHDIPVYRYVDDSGKPFTARKQSKDRIIVKEEKRPKAGKLDTWRGPRGGGRKRLGADQTKKRRAAPAGAQA